MTLAILQQNMGKHIELGISGIERNKDGSVLVRWGYNNNGTNPVNMRPGRDYLEVTHGSALSLRQIPSQLHCGYHLTDFEMVLIGDTEVVWNWFGKSFSLNSSLLDSTEASA